MIRLFAATVISALFVSAACTKNSRRSIAENAGESAIGVCEIYASPSTPYEKTLRLRGKVRGYHHLVLFDPNCDDENHWIVLQTSYLEFSRFYEQTNRSKGTTSDVSGEAIVSGVLKRKSGTIPSGESAIFDTVNKKLIEISPERTVDLLADVRIESFTPGN